MTLPERLYRWNLWYDELPQEWRFQVVMWPLIAVAFVNMMLTLAIRFPFGLLLLVGVICFAAVRVPYVLGWIAPGPADRSDEPDARRFEISGADWLVDVNQRYEAMPDARRFWVYPIVLLTAGAINMALTIAIGFPFGLLFLLALLALIVIRAPYAAGWLKATPSATTPVLGERDSPRISHDSASMMPEEPRSVEPAMLSTPAPQATQRERQLVDRDEPTVSPVDVKAAAPAIHDDSVAVAPPPAPPATLHETRAVDLSEPRVPPVDDVPAAPPAVHDDGVAVAPSLANEMPPTPAAEPDEAYAANDQPIPPRKGPKKT